MSCELCIRQLTAYFVFTIRSLRSSEDTSASRDQPFPPGSREVPCRTEDPAGPLIQVELAETTERQEQAVELTALIGQYRESCLHKAVSFISPLIHWGPSNGASRPYTSASPLLSASNARTSVTYCSASSRGIKCSKSLSVGSLIQPSIGIALSAKSN